MDRAASAWLVFATPKADRQPEGIVKNFEDREKGFEAEFKRSQELQFRVNARRNKLFGLWAAEKLGLSHRSDYVQFCLRLGLLKTV